MKPINEKERTLAFVQFLVLFILTIILTVFFVFFPFKIRDKEVMELKEKLKHLSNSQFNYSTILQLLDSANNSINSLDNVDKNAYSGREYTIRNNFLSRLGSINDTSDISKLQLKVNSICNNWMIDKSKLKQIDDLNSTIYKQSKTIENLQNLLQSAYHADPKDVEALKIK